MKKIIIAILLATLAVGCAPKMTFYESLPYEGVNPKVDSIISTIYQTKKGANGKWMKDPEDVQHFTQVFTNKGVLDSTKHHLIFMGDKTEFTNTTFDIRHGNIHSIASTRSVWGKERHTRWELVHQAKGEWLYHVYDFENNVDTVIVHYDVPTTTKISVTQDHLGNKKKEETAYRSNRPWRTVVDMNGEPYFSQEFEYDEKGLLTKEKVTERSNKPYEIRYTYEANDEHGNWTLQKAYVGTGNELSSVTERKLVYR